MKNRAAVYRKPDANQLDQNKRKPTAVSKSTEHAEMRVQKSALPEVFSRLCRGKTANKGKIILKPINDTSSRV